MANVIAGCFFHEIWLFVAVFLGGYTLFTSVIGGIAMLYRGALFGFAFTMLQYSSKSGLLLDSLVYLGESLSVTLLLASLAAAAAEFYYKDRRPVLFSSSSAGFFTYFLKICGLVFCCLCFMLFLFYIYF